MCNIMPLEVKIVNRLRQLYRKLSDLAGEAVGVVVSQFLCLT